MAKQQALGDMSIPELEAQRAKIAAARSDTMTKIKELEASIRSPELDPTLTFEEAVAAIGGTDGELRAARAFEQVQRQQLDAITSAITAIQQRERQERAAAMQPEIDTAKAAVCEAHQAYVAALERAREVDRRYTGVALSRSPLTELFSDDLRKALRQQAHRFLIHAPSEAEAAGVSENVLR